MTETQTAKVELTDSEWMSLLDGERDGLPRCCANVSALRDALMSVVRGGCEVGPFDRLQVQRTLWWVVEGHDLDPDGPLVKLAGQVGLSLIPPEEHPRQVVE